MRICDRERKSSAEFFDKLGDAMPEVLKLMRQMFLVRIETLKKRKWGRQRLD